MDKKCRGARSVTVDGEEYEVFFTVQDAVELEDRLSHGSLFTALSEDLTLKDSLAILDVATKGKLSIERLPDNFAEVMYEVVAALAYSLGQDISVPEDMQAKKKAPKRKKK